MNKSDLFTKKVNTLLKILLSFSKNIHYFFNEKYNTLLFIINKQKTIKKIYEPLINEKTTIEKSLRQDLAPLIKDNNTLLKEIKKGTYDNLKLEADITMIQSLLVNDKSLR